MTALVLHKAATEEISLLLQRLAAPIEAGDGLTHDETCDLRAWLRALRQRVWDDLREARGTAANAEIVQFRKVECVMEGRLPSRFCEDARPSDSPMGDDA